MLWFLFTILASQYLFVFIGALVLARYFPWIKEKTDGLTIGTKPIALILRV